MVIEGVNIEEQLASMKATLDRLSRESGERTLKSSFNMSKLLS